MHEGTAVLYYNGIHEQREFVRIFTYVYSRPSDADDLDVHSYANSQRYGLFGMPEFYTQVSVVLEFLSFFSFEISKLKFEIKLKVVFFSEILRLEIA